MNMSSIFKELAMNLRDLESQRTAKFNNLISQLREYVNNSDLVKNETDPELGVVFFTQSVARLSTLDETFTTVEEAQQWLDEITSSKDFLKKYKCPRRVVLRQQDSGKPWPVMWICEHERGTDEVFVTFCPGSLHRGAILYELAQVLRSESSPGFAAQHDREFRRVLLALVGAYGDAEYKRWLQLVFKELKLPYTAVRRRQNDGMTYPHWES